MSSCTTFFSRSVLIISTLWIGGAAAETDEPAATTYGPPVPLTQGPSPSELRQAEADLAQELLAGYGRTVDVSHSVFFAGSIPLGFKPLQKGQDSGVCPTCTLLAQRLFDVPSSSRTMIPKRFQNLELRRAHR